MAHDQPRIPAKILLLLKEAREAATLENASFDWPDSTMNAKCRSGDFEGRPDEFIKDRVRIYPPHVDHRTARSGDRVGRRKEGDALTMTEREMWRVYDWFSYSHWGMFRLPLFTAPDWFISGTCQDVDDEDIELVVDGESTRETKEG